jgi:hypothetical protein
MVRIASRVGPLALVAASLFGVSLLYGAAPEPVPKNPTARAAATAPVALEPADARLTRDFLQHSASVLDGSGFAPSSSGFTARTPDTGTGSAVETAEAALSARGGLRLDLPARGEGAATLTLPGGFAVEVRERGLEGRGRQVLGAVAYTRASGTSYWRTTEAGYEEWLLLAEARKGPVATWEVQGGLLRQDGDDVLVTDAEGNGHLRVTAPRAYGEGGHPALAWLRAEGQVISLHTTARGRALVDPLWTTVGRMATPRAYYTATLLPSGKVLVAGGYTHSYSRYSGGKGLVLASAELYDPVTRTWGPTGSLATARYSHTATLLPTGAVLVAGGYGGGGLASAELYDPSTGAWRTTGPMATARSAHTATLLKAGKVLVTGDSSAELYDPATETWKATGFRATMSPLAHTATLLNSGKVLVTGDSSAELYDPATEAWSATGVPAEPRSGYTATLLASGKVLLAGGMNGTGLLTRAELYDPGTESWNRTGSMVTARRFHTATLLTSGKVLVAGGLGNNSTRLTSAELYDPDASAWSATESAATGGFYQTATLLPPSGKVLLTTTTGLPITIYANFGSSVEVYDPTGLVISPLVIRLAPGASQSFSASGGSGTGYTWALVANDAGGTLSATGVYTAGSTVGLSDYVGVTDSVGNFAMAQAFVTTDLSISPVGGLLAPRASQSFSASGGSGTGYTWDLALNASGGAVSATGLYTAGPIGGVYDVIRVTDSLGNFVVADMTVTGALTISPASVSIVRGASQTFYGSGGSGTGFRWSLLTNSSGATLTAYGVYTAGSTDGVRDVVGATDSLGNSATATVDVGTTTPVVVSPSQVTVARLASRTFTASGGSGIYAWALSTNASGGSMSAAGVYTAGATGGVTDEVRVTDSVGRSATAVVTVLPPLAISPSSVSLAPRTLQTFTASGGSGAGYAWSLQPNLSGGSVSASGVYTAGATGGVTDVVRLTDSAGDAAMAEVKVTTPPPALRVSPSDVTLEPNASQTFTASGGSGAGYRWALTTNASGGSLGATTGMYTAGAKGGVTDIVQVTDSLGTSATASVTVTVPTPTTGCTTSGGSAFPLLALVALPLLVSRRRREAV